MPVRYLIPQIICKLIMKFLCHSIISVQWKLDFLLIVPIVVERFILIMINWICLRSLTPPSFPRIFHWRIIVRIGIQMSLSQAVFVGSKILTVRIFLIHGKLYSVFNKVCSISSILHLKVILKIHFKIYDVFNDNIK